MPTLQEITLAHSQRLSEIYRTRDIRLAEAQSLRDVQLRALPTTAEPTSNTMTISLSSGKNRWPPKVRLRRPEMLRC